MSTEAVMAEKRLAARKKGVFWPGLILAAVGLMLWGTAVPARAEGDFPVGRVFDRADLFSGEEEERLEAEIQRLREKLGMDAVLVTVEDTQGKTSEEYGDDFYDETGFGTGEDASGVLFLMDMDNRELYISTSGEMAWLLTDERIGSMLEDGTAHMGEGDYSGCAYKLFSDTLRFQAEGIADGQYQVDRDTGKVVEYRKKRRREILWYEALFAAGVAAFCAGSVCRKVRREYAMEEERGRAANYYMAYRADAGFRLRNQEDTLVRSHIARQVIARDVSRSTNAGRGGGRSTVHRSSSGRTHGGGGRKF